MYPQINTFNMIVITVYTCSFDLWEEIHSSSFFTTAVQHRALREGAALAAKIGHSPTVKPYITQADNILCFLQVDNILHFIWPQSHCIFSPIGTRQVATSRPTREAAGLGRTRIPSLHLSTHGTSAQDAMRAPFSRAQTRHCPISRFTLTHFAPSTPSTRALTPRPLSRSDVTQKTYTITETYFSHCRLHEIIS